MTACSQILHVDIKEHTASKFSSRRRK